MVEGVLSTPDRLAPRCDKVLRLDQDVTLRAALLIEYDHAPPPGIVEADDLPNGPVEARLGLQPSDLLSYEPDEVIS